MRRGEIWWADLPPPAGSGPGGRRPVVVVQSNRFTQSRLNTVVIIAVTTNLRLGYAPGNVSIPGGTAGLQYDSVANVTQIVAVDQALLTDYVGELDTNAMRRVDDGLRLLLGL